MIKYFILVIFVITFHLNKYLFIVTSTIRDLYLNPIKIMKHFDQIDVFVIAKKLRHTECEK